MSEKCEHRHIVTADMMIATVDMGAEAVLRF